MDQHAVTEEMIDLVSKTAAKPWKKLALKLPIAKTMEESIGAVHALEVKYPANLKDQCYFMLVQWVTEHENVTVQHLVKCMRSLDCNKIASDLEKMLHPTSKRIVLKVDTRTSCILILAEEWDNPEDPFSLITKRMAEMLATHCQPKMEVFCTVLNQTKHSSQIVKILHPRSLEGHVDPKQKLRAFFGAYYLPDLTYHRADIIIGLSPLTADAVFTVRDGHFRDAKAIIINNCIPSEAHVWLGENELIPEEKDMIQWAKQADIVVSAGIKVFDFYKSLLPPENPHLKYFPLSCYQCKTDHQLQSPRTRSMHAYSYQSCLDVQGPVLEAISCLTADQTLDHWNIYIKAELQEEAEQRTIPCCTFKAIPDSEEDVHSSLCESSIYIDSEEKNPMWGRGLDAISHCVPFCTSEDSHLAKTLAYFEEFVDQYFVECDEDPRNWERKFRKCLDPQKLYKMVHLRRDILLPKATVENHTLITTICAHVTLTIYGSLPSNPHVDMGELSETTTNGLARDLIDGNLEESSSIMQLQLAMGKDVQILAVKHTGSIRLAMVAPDKQSLDELFERSRTPQIKSEISNVILQQTYAREWLETNEVAAEDISFNPHIDQKDYRRYRRILDERLLSARIVDLSRITLKRIGTIDIKTDTDTSRENWIPAMTVDDDNNLFLCDSSNKCVKCIDSDKVKWTSSILTSSPQGIGILQTGEIAVTLENNNSLLLLDSRDGTECKRINHGITCNWPALSVHKDTIVIGDDNKRDVTVFDISNYDLVKSHVIAREQSTSSLHSPQYVHVTPGLTVIVTDNDTNTLQSFNIKGQCQFTYGSGKPGSGQGQLSMPCNVCTDQAGNILVADCKNRRVVLLSPTGRYVKDLLTKNDGLSESPLALTLSREGVLYVSNDSSELQVFQ